MNSSGVGEGRKAPLPSPRGGGESLRSSFGGLLAAILLAACSPTQTGPNLKTILAEDAAPNLSDYGLFTDASARQPAAGVTPYDLVNPLFSDHAAKHRLVFTPKGKAAAYNADGVFDFPIGSVLVKTFAFAPDMRDPATDERYIETRLLIRKEAGWVAYPYVWNAEQTEATYAPVGKRERIETIAPSGEPLSIDYHVPNQNQCKTCHAAGKALTPIGPKARNLNHEGPAGVNQLSDWTARGHVTGAPDPAAAPAIPAAFDAAAPLGDRARAWLDVNCAHCHNASGGASNSGLFLDWAETDPTGWGVLKRPVAAGRGAGGFLFVIDPGSPDTSILVHRIASNEPGVMMPELGQSVTDEPGLGLIREWIAAMPSQPS
jgi:uncharacterized repeat protein (TIGR03806 family)